MILLYLAASGWMSIRFSSFRLEIKMHYYVYMIVIIFTLCNICNSFFLNHSVFSCYNFIIIIYMGFIGLESYKSYKKTQKIHNFNIENNNNNNRENNNIDNNSYNFIFNSAQYKLCVNTKLLRFKILFVISLSYIIIYLGLIFFYYFYSKDLYFCAVKIIFDNIIITLLLLLYKPSKIILKNHVCPNKYLNFNKVSFKIIIKHKLINYQIYFRNT